MPIFDKVDKNGNVSKEVTPCISGDTICVPNTVMNKIRKQFNLQGKDDMYVLKYLANNYKDKVSGGQIWSHELARLVTEEIPDLTKDEIKKLEAELKPYGPADSDQLLSNHNIDEVLDKWCVGHSRYYHMPFHMINFMENSQGEKLKNIKLADLIKDYDSFFVVLNTDTYAGNGKHWFCIYVDLTGKSRPHIDDGPTNTDTNKPKEGSILIEFFNSSGNPPMPELMPWFAEQIEYAKSKGINMEWARIVKKPAQKSNTECGVWCLLYIRSRMEKKDILNIKNLDADQWVLDMRKHIFHKG